MLTASEIKSLRQSKVEIAQRLSELAGLREAFTPASEKSIGMSFQRTAKVGTIADKRYPCLPS